MKIVEPSVKFLWGTPDPLKMIEVAGRTAYKSEDLITATSAEAFVKMLLKRGHESVIEHACASLHIVTDRGVTHEIVRHRIFSYTQESTRYCNYSKSKFSNEIAVVKPPFKTAEEEHIWEAAVLEAEDKYMGLTAQGSSPQLARSVLPTCLKTEIVVTGNCREWRHFFKTRMSPAAHPQMVQVATMAYALLKEWAPTIFEGIEIK